MVLSSLDLRILVALRQGKTLTQIGRELLLRHPTLSRSLHAAERKAGVSLVERSGRRLRLTTAGEAVAAAALVALDRYEDVDRLIGDLRLGEAGHVQIIATRTACSYVIPTALTEFLTRYSKATVTLEPTAPGDLWRRFVAEGFDLAVGPKPADPTIKAERLTVEELGLFVRADSHLASVNQLADLEIETLIAPAAGEGQALWKDEFQRRRIRVGRWIDVRHQEAAKELVRNGVGVSLGFCSSMTRELSTGVLVRLGGASLSFQSAFWLARRETTRPARLVEGFVELLRSLPSSAGTESSSSTGANNRARMHLHAS